MTACRVEREETHMSSSMSLMTNRDPGLEKSKTCWFDVVMGQIAMVRDSQEWWPGAQTWDRDAEDISTETTVEIT